MWPIGREWGGGIAQRGRSLISPIVLFIKHYKIWPAVQCYSGAIVTDVTKRGPFKILFRFSLWKRKRSVAEGLLIFSR